METWLGVSRESPDFGPLGLPELQVMQHRFNKKSGTNKMKKKLADRR
jgi:hypothetical protein